MSLINIAYIINKLNLAANKYCLTHSIQGKLRLDILVHLSYQMSWHWISCRTVAKRDILIGGRLSYSSIQTKQTKAATVQTKRLTARSFTKNVKIRNHLSIKKKSMYIYVTKIFENTHKWYNLYRGGEKQLSGAVGG